MRRRPRGSGQIVRDGAGYALRIRGASEVYESGFRTRAEAEARAAILRTERINKRLGIAADPRQTPTLSALAAPWIERRKATHSAGAEDGYRWANHLAPSLGHLRPDEVTVDRIRALVETKRGELAPGTLRVLVSTLSALFEDLLERGLARENPARRLPRSLLRLIRPDHDPRTTPWVERMEDVRRIYLALRPRSIQVGYAIGALAGLRPGEVFGLRWTSVDFERRLILVHETRKGQTKDKDPRPVPLLDTLLPVLQAWRLESGGAGLVCPPLRRDGRHISKGTPGPILRAALRRLGLHRLADYEDAWYAATRHTFASHWASEGRSLRELQAILGHESISTTERYAHLQPGHFAPGAREALAVDLTTPDGSVRQIKAGAPAGEHATPRKNKRKTGAAL